MRSSLLFLSCLPAVAAIDPVVQVMFVGGQSNCQGLGDRDHLIDLATNPATSGQYGKYFDATFGSLQRREDVYVVIEPERSQSGQLTPRFGDAGNKFGIEVGMGWVLGDYFEEDLVLIVKHCEIEPLATEWRPPSSGNTGSSYSNAIQTYRSALEEVETIFATNGNGLAVEPLAFVWIHGYADAFEPDYLAEYEQNLDNLLTDMTQELDVRGSVVVQTGGGGPNPPDDGEELELRDIQASVVAGEDPATTKLVETFQFSGGDPIDDETYVHYFGRADNYINIGEAVGEAIVEIVEGPEMTLAPAPTEGGSPRCINGNQHSTPAPAPWPTSSACCSKRLFLSSTAFASTIWILIRRLH